VIKSIDFTLANLATLHKVFGHDICNVLIEKKDEYLRGLKKVRPNSNSMLISDGNCLQLKANYIWGQATAEGLKWYYTTLDKTSH